MTGGEEIRRRKTSDPEIDALHVLVQAFGELDTLQIKRLLEWAEDRFITAPRDRETRLNLDGLLAQFEALDEHAAKLGVKSNRLANAIWHVRAVEKELAPLDDDPDPLETERRVTSKLGLVS